METLRKARPAEARWISQGFESLVHQLSVATARPEFDFDVLIVGTGYGGAIAARELSHLKQSQGALRVAALERGQEYLPGTFPAHESELPAHIRFSTADNATPRGTREGLFDIRVGPDVSAVLANGLGGGSLINAGVMLEPDASAFGSWPGPLRVPRALEPFFTDAKRLLGSLIKDDNNSAREKEKTIHDHASAKAPPDKFVAMRRLGGNAAAGTPFTVSMQSGANQSGVQLAECAMCGNCMTGCNFSAKNSLDEGLLAEAFRGGVDLYTGATVLDLYPAGQEGWTLRVVHTDPKLRRQECSPHLVRARRVILAAGTFGTSEILIRSKQRHQLKLSKQLGHGFSGNGDLLTAAYNLNIPVNAIAEDGARPIDGKVGPTITGMIDLRTGDKHGVMIQEFAIPAPMRRIFQETSALAHCFHQLSQYDAADHRDSELQDPQAIDHDALDKTLLLGVMGHDGSAGEIHVPESAADDVDGIAHVVWSSVRDDAKTPVFVNQIAKIEALMKNSGLNGALLQNPSWKLIPTSLTGIFEMPNGPALTVHPLGGCRMGDDSTQGVVDHVGRVFNDVTGDGTHDGLVVLDGSMIPSSLGVNPALTIAAVSLRAIRELTKAWQLVPKDIETQRPLSPSRPVLRTPPSRKNELETHVRILERMTGKAVLPQLTQHPLPCVIELTLQFQDCPIARLSGTTSRSLAVDSERSRLRIFEDARWQQLVELGEPEHVRDAAALLIAPLEGTMEVLRRGDSTAGARVDNALAAWKKNRGYRDIWQGLSMSNLFSWRKLCAARRALASHAGELRLFHYSLQVGSPLKGPEHIAFAPGPIVGFKRLTYDMHCNPWNQLMQLRLTRFSDLPRPPMLELDLRFLASEGVPLMQIVRQPDHATALLDVVSFLLYLVRLLISIHLWSFRKPDRSWGDKPQRLAGSLSGVRLVSQDYIHIDAASRICLTRYQGRYQGKSPVLLIHGYSANSTTFAHPKIQPNLVTQLCDAGRDVWVVDLRTSSGLDATRNLPWTFDDMAAMDIPAAIQRIWETRVKEGSPRKIDVVAHCMGAAMLAMSILQPPTPRFAVPGMRTRDLLGSVVLSQIGPVMVFTAANVFRGFAMSYLKYLFRFDELDFSPPETLMSEVLDRALSTLPYPEEEFPIENPSRFYRTARYTRTRHRMDAWFGRVFRLANMEPGVLRHIDDLFGPVNLSTLFQTMHFARRKVITNHAGHNFGVSRANLRSQWTMPTLSIHGMENGLADISTVRRLDAVMMDALPPERRHEYKLCRAKGFGHQDCLIGRDRERVFAEIIRFLESPSDYQPDPNLSVSWPVPAVRSSVDSSSNRSTADLVQELLDSKLFANNGELLVRKPWIGPVVGRDPATNNPRRIRLTADPQLGLPHSAAFVPVMPSNDRYEPSNANLTNIHIESWPSAAPSAMEKIFDVPDTLATADQGFLTFLLYEQSPAVGTGEYEDFTPDESEETKTRIVRAIKQFMDEEPFELLTPAYVEANGLAAVAATDRLTATAAKTDSDLCFALGSCQYPAGALDRELAAQSYGRLAELLETGPASSRPSFAVLTGDQVYVDATAGLFDPTVQDDRYSLPYEKWLQTDAVRRVLKKINVYTMLDDHEIDDNWAPVPFPTWEHRQYRERGIDAYVKVREVFGPPLLAPTGDSRRPLWYTLSLNGFEFFFADTRSERVLRQSANADEAKMMSRAQLQALLDWIREHAKKERPKFVVSPSILLPRHLGAAEADDSSAPRNPAATLRSDAWDGYPDTFFSLLAHIATLQPRNLIFLSGDEHRPCIADIEIKPRNGSVGATIFHSVHSSPLYAPYPFANGHEHSFAASETFEFADPSSKQRFECAVAARFPTPADGFLLLDYRSGEKPKLRLTFLRASGSTAGIDIPLQ